MVRKYSAVLAQLGDREPSSILEAQAVIESIRAAKGYLEEDFLRHVRSMPPQSCDKVLQMNERLRETEAAFTTRLIIKPIDRYALIVIAYQSSYTHRSIDSSTKLCRMRMIHIIVIYSDKVDQPS